MCKHAVALVLHYLRERPAMARSVEGTLAHRAALDHHARPAKPVEGAFADHASLDAFVTAHRVEHALALSAEVLASRLTLLPQDYWLRSLIARLTVRDVATVEAAARHARSRNLDVALARVAYEVLHEAATDVRAGPAEEPERGAIAPSPDLAPLWTRLLQIRRTAREHAVRPYSLEKGGDGLQCFFRDDHLSDLIGFEYSRWHGKDAANHFVNQVSDIAQHAAGNETPVVSVILDGENAWEYYP